MVYTRWAVRQHPCLCVFRGLSCRTSAFRFQPALRGTRQHTGETLVFSLTVGLWPGYAAPIGIRVIAA